MQKEREIGGSVHEYENEKYPEEIWLPRNTKNPYRVVQKTFKEQKCSP